MLHITPSSKSAEYDKVCEAVFKSRNLVALTGAGISCNSGIPDFRSKDGLYALLTRDPTPSTSKTRIEDALPPVDDDYESVLDSEEEDTQDDLLRPAKRIKLAQSVKGQDLFSANLFRQKQTAQLFYIFMSSLYAKCHSATPTPTHRFLKKLSDKNKLLRCYTQNIDGLEGRAGLSYAFDYAQSNRHNAAPASASAKASRKQTASVVQLHGALDAVRCGCSWAGPWTEEMVRSMQQGTPPPCPDCQSVALKRRSRGARAVKQVGHYGHLKPSVLLYDEAHPPGTTETILDYSDADVQRPVDLVLVMGTSLKVPGFCGLVKDFIKTAKSSHPQAQVTAVLVNQTDVATGEWKRLFDVFVQDDCDRFVGRVTELWKRRRPEDFLQQPTVLGTSKSNNNKKATPVPSMFKSAKVTHAMVTPGKRKPVVPRERNSSPDLELVNTSSSRRQLNRKASSSLLLISPSSPKKAGEKRKRAQV